MTAPLRRFRPGDVVPPAEGVPGGEVVALRDLSPTRQWLSVKGADGVQRAAVFDLGPDAARALVEAVEPGDARALALTILAGRDPRMSVTHQINVLAGALVALTEANGGTP